VSALGFLGEALGQRKDGPVQVKRRRPERRRGRAERLNWRGFHSRVPVVAGLGEAGLDATGLTAAGYSRRPSEPQEPRKEE
jgi:hypothetical protein